jgi:NTP pyrophosphatase (non-canonical NTP hydrolase)
MDFDTYQTRAAQTAIYPGKDYPVFGLAEEAGEVCGIIAKASRDNGGILDGEKVLKLRKELGDVLWMVAMISYEYGLSLQDVAQANLEKLADRKNRGVLGGSGDDR